MSDNKKTVLIVGLGLLGGSLGMALRNSSWRRLGWTRRKEIREWALQENVVDATDDDVEQLLATADLTVICLPVPHIIDFIRNHANDWRAGAVVTDIGSVKEVIVNCGESYLRPEGVHFVGSHPMAGTEKSGPAAAFPTLYRNAETLITPIQQTNQAALDIVTHFWRDIGTKTVTIAPREHDLLVAHTSHISHLLALALTQTALDCPEPEQARRYSACATGFRDTSRISSSSPVMWREIIEHNQSAILTAMQEFENHWRRLRATIEKRDFDGLEQEFGNGKELRDNWLKYKNFKKTGAPEWRTYN